jgi:hypothetical protein
MALAKALQVNRRLQKLMWDDNGTTGIGFAAMRQAMERNQVLHDLYFSLSISLHIRLEYIDPSADPVAGAAANQRLHGGGSRRTLERSPRLPPAPSARPRERHLPQQGTYFSVIHPSINQSINQ